MSDLPARVCTLPSCKYSHQSQCTTLNKNMQVAIDLACWLLIVVGILPTGNIFLNNIQTFIGQSRQRVGTLSACIYIIHTPTMHCMVTGSKAFRHWPNLLSILNAEASGGLCKSSQI